MRQMAVITPYAQFLFRFLSDTAEYEFSSLVICVLLIAKLKIF
jgi:hypothetical protein